MRIREACAVKPVVMRDGHGGSQPMPLSAAFDFGAPMLVLDNVTAYLYAGTDQEVFELGDFPNCAPPWGRFWWDTVPSRVVRSLGTVREETSFPPGLRHGGFVEAVEIVPGTGARVADGLLGLIDFISRGRSVGDRDLTAARDSFRDAIGRAKWWLSVIDLLTARHQPVVNQGFWIYPVMADGALGQPLGVGGIGHGVQMHWPLLLGLSFLHCRNVTVREVQEARPPARRKGSRARDAVEPKSVKYYTLEIGAMQEVLRAEGRASEVGLLRALHICRGHFAHYGEEFGMGKLFGRWEGTFWVPQHLRGTAEAGVVKKDYRIGEQAVPRHQEAAKKWGL